jgi:pyruvate formate lyase activating enzyme
LKAYCITGGEPTVWKDQLFDFISIIKSEGFLVKLDTNGSNPEVLQFLLTHKMIDFVAMDIKNVWEKYLMTIGLRSLFPLIK